MHARTIHEPRNIGELTDATLRHAVTRTLLVPACVTRAARAATWSSARGPGASATRRRCPRVADGAPRAQLPLGAARDATPGAAARRDMQQRHDAPRAGRDGCP